VQTDCASWLADVEKALPTVVLTAKNGDGADLVDVKVSVDGQPLVAKLDGQAVPMNPGSHTFHFEGVGGTSQDRQVVVREGDKNQPVAAVLGAASSAPPASPLAPPVAGGGAGETPESSSSLKTVGWVLGGVGVAGLAAGTVFGIVAMSSKSGAHCDANNVCDPGTTSGIKTTALLSDIGWVAGGVLTAGGLALVLLAPSPHHEGAATVRIAPVVAAQGGGVTVGGAW
jgi:hypothetical protein